MSLQNANFLIYKLAFPIQKEAAKKEEAIASFEAWKAMKKREAKKVAEKKKLEELKKRRATEQNEEKKEEAQKVRRNVSFRYCPAYLSNCFVNHNRRRA